MKRCSACGVEKPLSDFQKDATKRLGVRSRCRECLADSARQRVRIWRSENRERANESRRARRLANLEAERERSRQKERARRSTPEWREYQRQWRTQNVEALNAIMRRHRARYPRWSRATTDPDTAAYLHVLLNDPCGLCGARNSLEIDHIVPRSRGGTNHWTNLSVLCRSCNASKNDKPLLLSMALVI